MMMMSMMTARGLLVVFALVLGVTTDAFAANKAMFYATFRGESDTPINNVVAFDSSGAIVNSAVLADPPSGITLDELRSLHLDRANDVLYVCNAHKSHSSVLRFGPADQASGIRKFVDVFANLSASDPGLVHPYKIVIHQTSGNVYVSNQDTAEVLCFDAKGVLCPVSSYLQHTFPTLSFDAGTFSPSAQTVGQKEGGLVTPRGMVFSANGSILYVADNGGSVVRSYSVQTGEFLGDVWTSGSGGQPVGILLLQDGQTLLVSVEGDNAVIAVDLKTDLASVLTNGFDHPAGMFVDCNQVLYVADRKAGFVAIVKLGGETPAKFQQFTDQLQDDPEQLLLLESC
eukprot:ANDGO_02274.mRNA.1 hypothetical protein